ncbi:MAG: Tm-1-like ATP-binding domain-containing protein [Deltaproteobacteria bacterium]|nr:Tm-1-like ATP-binding domain-containing protein [Deltaproteobacteria bacterium]MBW2333840.1 Tm-1-like ATP-binding domain-containing protein [Deltaproteobacteria bacterium]
MVKTVAIVGTLDTKGEEIAFLKSLILTRSHKVIIADTGILGEPHLQADISRHEIASAGGEDIDTLKKKGDEAFAQRIMASGLKKIILSLVESKKIHGLLAIGGGQGSIIVAPTLKSLPFGFPKLLVSTKVTQAGARPYVGSKDVLILPPVADLAGINCLTRSILTNAAGAISGMVEIEQPGVEDKPLVVMSMNGTVTDCGLTVKAMLEKKGYEVLVFHTIGTGGEALEEYVKSNEVVGVIELGVNEITNELMGGLASSGPDRLTAAGKRGVPQIVVPGSADFINFLGPETVPPKYRRRNIHSHNPQATLIRTNIQDNRLLGKTIADKLNQSRGPVIILWPKKGLSTLDHSGKPFWDPEADMALIKSLKRHLDPHIPVIESDAYINDPEFAQTVFMAFEKIGEQIRQQTTLS